MVGVRFMGRLGNQLFQYYFLQYLRKKGDIGFYFFPNPHHAYFARYFDLGWYHNLTLNSKLYSAFTRVLPHLLPLKEVYMHNFVSPRERETQNNSIYNGYFQSDYYIKALHLDTPPPIKRRYTESFDEKFGDLFKNHPTLTVHIRRTDYLNYQNRDISLPIAHFQRQLDRIPNLDSYKVFFVSDDLDYVKQHIRIRPNYIFESNDEITDFQLIQNADVAIISNSTFAWWACYLSPKENRVIAPKNWMGFRIGREHPRGIMTDRFEWVEVEPPASGEGLV